MTVGFKIEWTREREVGTGPRHIPSQWNDGILTSRHRAAMSVARQKPAA